jgi:RNA polymerase sigma-70 factor (ECF subfamily)
MVMFEDGSPAESAAHVNALVEAMVDNRCKLLAIARKVLRAGDEAEDIFHDAVLKACDMAGQCIDRPENYACRMVRNLALDEARKRCRLAKIRLPVEEIETLPECAPDAQRHVEARQALAAVMQAITELPDRTRHAFVNHRIAGVPQKDVARSLGVSPTLVNFMVRDAQARCAATVEP